MVLKSSVILEECKIEFQECAIVEPSVPIYKKPYDVVRSRLDRSVELHANVFRENDVDNMRVNESEVM